jgi:hypothetical protein
VLHIYCFDLDEFLGVEFVELFLCVKLSEDILN